MSGLSRRPRQGAAALPSSGAGGIASPYIHCLLDDLFYHRGPPVALSP